MPFYSGFVLENFVSQSVLTRVFHYLGISSNYKAMSNNIDNKTRIRTLLGREFFMIVFYSILNLF